MSIESFFKGWLGEQGTNLLQHLALDPKEYHVFYDLLVGEEPKRTQIDHVIVSKFGIFAVETKNYQGWIYGRESDDKWTQKFPGSSRTFQNPLRQNALHTSSLAAFCEVDPSTIYSIIVFWGDCEFKTPMPENVIKWIKYPFYVKSKTKILLNDSEVEKICAKLKPSDTHIPIVTNILHANVIKNQNANSTSRTTQSVTTTQTGHCISCGTSIPLDVSKPYCLKCWNASDVSKDNEFVPIENFCHFCGGPSKTSIDKPLCYSCYKKNEK
jgi:restriction system protein